MSVVNRPYPRECPVCGDEQPTMSSFDLHMERNHSETEADRAVMAAIHDELEAMAGERGDSA